MQLETARGIFGVTDSRGSGPALVLLHPFPLDRRAFDTLIPTLSDRHRVLTVETRGFGESPARGSFSIADLADDVAAVLDRLSIERASVLGNSMGGYTALAFAARHRARLDRLILVDTRANADGPEAIAARNTAIETIIGKGAAAYLAGTEDRLLGPKANRPLRDLVKNLVDQPGASLIAALHALRDRPNREPELGTIVAPTLVVCGEHDAVTPPDVARALAAAIPNARYVGIPDVGHLVPLEAPTALAAAIAPLFA